MYSLFPEKEQGKRGNGAWACHIPIMTVNTKIPALLMLDDGTCFEGYALGACQEVVGEVVFTTGMSGYQETITDPSYYGQIVVFTSAHIGNYGATCLDSECPCPKTEYGASGIFRIFVLKAPYRKNWLKWESAVFTGLIPVH